MNCGRRLLHVSMVVTALMGAVVLGGLSHLVLGAAGGSQAETAATSVMFSATPDRPSVAPDVLRALSAAQDDTSVRLILVLHPTTEEPLPSVDGLSNGVLPQSREYYVQQKRAHFEEAKAPLLPILVEARRQGWLMEERELWLVDALGLEVTLPVAQALMINPAVAEVHLDHYVQYIEPVTSTRKSETLMAASIGTPWGTESVGAPRVWNTLAVSGTGAVVAVMDTGVDWQHPELYNAYRGNLGKGIFSHASAWHDVVNGGEYPYDDHGHGTHVLGTAVGSSVGVAPGARWIGVKVLNNEGYAYDSWILSGFQWLLAPNGDASLAPDVVNGSWSSSDSSATVFLSAIQALEEAGIFSVFASGNAGPRARSVGSPASNRGVFAVGASDPDGDVANFSGRGPSPWEEIKPIVVAPGVNVFSALPGGVYAEKNGTSMATPHVAGVGALMRSVSPTVSVATMVRIITETAQSLTTMLPNNDSGWGEIDAYAAILTLAKPAVITGVVTSGPVQPLPDAKITAWPDSVVSGEAPGFDVVSDARGRYALALMPGRYVVRASAFGHIPQTISRVDVVAGESQMLDFALDPQPTGIVRGGLSVAGSSEVLTTGISVLAVDTPVDDEVVDGTYSLILPEGEYTLEVRGLGYRVVTATVMVTGGVSSEQDFLLQPAPTLLLVDEGAWYYGSQKSYWIESLDALHYVYDQVSIKDAAYDLPETSELAPYDIVLWSSPEGSPGLVGAGSVLTDYLSTGGHLLLSGQDVAYLDGGGAAQRGAPEPYFADMMGALFLADEAETPWVRGSGPFAGLQLALTGGTGADNQVSPDVVTVRDAGLASPVFSYEDGTAAGIGAEICVPYRALLFSFGYEGIAELSDRQDVLQRSIDWLTTAPPVAGLTVSPVTVPALIGAPGEHVTHVVEIRHIGYAGVTETVRLSAAPTTWLTELSDEEFDLGPCTSALVTVTVAIPANAEVNASDRVTISATSDSVTTPVSTVLTSKTPASLLLVDDDRWYPMEDAYCSALDAAGIVYDLWDTQSGKGGTPENSSPPTRVLSYYPVVVWFTGYDWYAPVEEEEVVTMQQYLDQGGKLFLSSQDFVYHHQDDLLTERLGVMFADWAEPADRATGVLMHPAGQAWSPVALDYPFPNWSHTIEPLPSAVPVVRGQHGQPIGLANGAPDSSEARTLFYAFPLEALPLKERSRALANGIGWLSPLGATEWRVSPATAQAPAPVDFELVLHNSADVPMAVEAVHQIPAEFDVVFVSLPTGMEYVAASRELIWRGMVPPAAPVTLSWRAIWQGSEANVQPTVTLTLPAWDIAFVREAPFYGSGLNLSSSRWLSSEQPTVRITEPLTLVYLIQNDSANGPADVALSLWMMTGLGPLTASTPLTQGVALAGWNGVLEPLESRRITIPVQGAVWDRPVRIDALLTDAAGHRWEDGLWLTFDPWLSYMPVVR